MGIFTLTIFGSINPVAVTCSGNCPDGDGKPDYDEPFNGLDDDLDGKVDEMETRNEHETTPCPCGCCYLIDVYTYTYEGDGEWRMTGRSWYYDIGDHSGKDGNEAM